jgi:hypothetical protein
MLLMTLLHDTYIKFALIFYFSSNALAYGMFPQKSCVISVLLCKFKRVVFFHDSRRLNWIFEYWKLSAGV